MTIFHFFNCAILTFGPHAVYYSATPFFIEYYCRACLVDYEIASWKCEMATIWLDFFHRSEYDTLGTSIKAAVVYLITALVKLVCLATFLKVSESDSFDPYQELLKALIGFIDVAGLYFALTQLAHRNISQNHKFQAVGLGWAFADSVLHRLAPLWMGARGLEFTWDYILQGLEANSNEKQAQGFDSDYICLCRDSGNNAINHKLSEAGPGMAFPKGSRSRAFHFFGNGIGQLAAIRYMPETI
ncbi:hypothetical protein DH2020_035100 [Rehmannia glutinosa]|uniref:BOS complex subunit TMEM147 n=1 Tax=Rehmannia glutinosa TaxID=99300 RepID=A0ABR0V9R2_REHGL